jgi:hypothetical protein
LILPRSVLNDIGLPVYKTNFILVSDREDWLRYSYGIIDYYNKRGKTCSECFLPERFPLIVISTVLCDENDVYIEHHILDDETILSCICPSFGKQERTDTLLD